MKTDYEKLVAAHNAYINADIAARAADVVTQAAADGAEYDASYIVRSEAYAALRAAWAAYTIAKEDMQASYPNQRSES